MSATSGSAVITANAFANYVSTQDVNTLYRGTPSIPFTRNLGTGDINRVFAGKYTITSGSPQTIDLTSVTDAFGNAISFNTIKHVSVVNTDTVYPITVGGGSNPIMGQQPSLVGNSFTTGSNGSCLSLTTDITVDGTHKNLLLQASSGAPVVNVLITGKFGS